MRHKQQGPLLTEAPQKAHAFLHKVCIAHGQRLIDDQYIRIDMCYYGKSEPHHHTTRVGLDRLIQEITNICELDDTFEPLFDGILIKAQNRGIQNYVLTAGKLRIESRA